MMYRARNLRLPRMVVLAVLPKAGIVNSNSHNRKYPSLIPMLSKVQNYTVIPVYRTIKLIRGNIFLYNRSIFETGTILIIEVNTMRISCTSCNLFFFRFEVQGN